MPKPLPELPRGGRKTPAPPRHFDKQERDLWRRILEAYPMDDAASLALLATTLESHKRMRRCRETIDNDGETVLDRFKQMKPHPLLAPERDARAAFLSGMRILRLDLGELA